MEVRKVLFPFIGGAYAIFFAIELNPTFFELVHNFIAPTEETLLIRTLIVWTLGALFLSSLYAIFRGNWKQLILVITIYFLAYYIEGEIWFQELKTRHELGQEMYEEEFFEEYEVVNFSNFLEYDRNHVGGSQLRYLIFKTLCFAILFIIPFWTSRLLPKLFRKNTSDERVIDD